MRSVRIAVIGALAVSGLVGCRNRVADERDALWNQNRQQQAELDRQKAEAQAAREQAEMERQRALAAQQQQQQAAPAPAPAAPEKPVEQIGGLETTMNKGAGTLTVNLPGDIFFDSGAATIRQPARASLDKVATALKKDYAGKMVRVEGHTDADPIKKSKWKSNQELSMARAAAVRDYLVKQGVSSDAIETTGFGADKPRSPKKAENRRVEVVVIVDANAPEAAAQTPSTSSEQSEPTVDTREFNK